MCDRISVPEKASQQDVASCISTAWWQRVVFQHFLDNGKRPGFGCRAMVFNAVSGLIDGEGKWLDLMREVLPVSSAR